MSNDELLERFKIDEFEKLYIAIAAESASPTQEAISDDQMKDVKTLAEYGLLQQLESITGPSEEQERLENASNFYVIPHTATHRYTVGNVEEEKKMSFYTVNDVEGYTLYSIINEKDISISTGFRERIENYLKLNYHDELEAGVISIDDVVRHFTPQTMDELYDNLSGENIITIRLLPDRIDEFVESRGIKPKELEQKEVGEKEVDLREQDNLAEETQVKPGDSAIQLEEDKDKDVEEDREEKTEDTEKDKNKEDDEVREESEETYIERIARVNHLKSAVVNTRIIENFEKVEEDTGIPLRGRYPRGEVVAVRVPYKLGYRTFLVEKSTGMTIDAKGRRERRPERLYDFDEIEDYFRFRLRNGADGGEDGKPLRYDEGRDYTTYIDETGELKEEKFINNKEEQDMLREERERYLTEVGEIDRKLKDAIDEYQKHATQENYEKVRDLIKEKINIDNKYNALEEQREVTKKTIENTENVIQRDLDDEDDSWFPGPRSRF